MQKTTKAEVILCVPLTNVLYQTAGAAPTHKLYCLDIPPNKAATGESTLLGRDKKPDRTRESQKPVRG